MQRQVPELKYSNLKVTRRGASSRELEDMRKRLAPPNFIWGPNKNAELLKAKSIIFPDVYQEVAPEGFLAFAGPEKSCLPKEDRVLGGGSSNAGELDEEKVCLKLAKLLFSNVPSLESSDVVKVDRKEHDLDHSYLYNRKSKTLYALNHVDGDSSYAGKGGFGGYKYVVKIPQFDQWRSGSDDNKKEEIIGVKIFDAFIIPNRSENEFLEQLGLSEAYLEIIFFNDPKAHTIAIAKGKKELSAKCYLTETGSLVSAQRKGYLLMPDGGIELCDFFKIKDHLSVSQKIDLCLMILEQLELLHGRNISHADVKPENLLVRLEGDEIKIRFTDFGFSRQGGLDIKRDKRFGTRNYLPVDVTMFTNRQLDVFALLRVILLPPKFENLDRDRGLYIHQTRSKDYQYCVFDPSDFNPNDFVSLKTLHKILTVEHRASVKDSNLSLAELKHFLWDARRSAELTETLAEKNVLISRWRPFDMGQGLLERLAANVPVGSHEFAVEEIINNQIACLFDIKNPLSSALVCREKLRNQVKLARRLNSPCDSVDFPASEPLFLNELVNYLDQVSVFFDLVQVRFSSLSSCFGQGGLEEFIENIKKECGLNDRFYKIVLPPLMMSVLIHEGVLKGHPKPEILRSVKKLYLSKGVSSECFFANYPGNSVVGLEIDNLMKTEKARLERVSRDINLLNIDMVQLMQVSDNILDLTHPEMSFSKDGMRDYVGECVQLAIDRTIKGMLEEHGVLQVMELHVSHLKQQALIVEGIINEKAQGMDGEGLSSLDLLSSISRQLQSHLSAFDSVQGWIPNIGSQIEGGQFDDWIEEKQDEIKDIMSSELIGEVMLRIIVVALLNKVCQIGLSYEASRDRIYDFLTIENLTELISVDEVDSVVDDETIKMWLYRIGHRLKLTNSVTSAMKLDDITAELIESMAQSISGNLYDNGRLSPMLVLSNVEIKEDVCDGIREALSTQFNGFLQSSDMLASLEQCLLALTKQIATVGAVVQEFDSSLEVSENHSAPSSSGPLKCMLAEWVLESLQSCFSLCDSMYQHISELFDETQILLSDKHQQFIDQFSLESSDINYHLDLIYFLKHTQLAVADEIKLDKIKLLLFSIQRDPELNISDKSTRLSRCAVISKELAAFVTNKFNSYLEQEMSCNKLSVAIEQVISELDRCIASLNTSPQSQSLCDSGSVSKPLLHSGVQSLQSVVNKFTTMQQQLPKLKQLINQCLSERMGAGAVMAAIKRRPEFLQISDNIVIHKIILSMVDSFIVREFDNQMRSGVQVKDSGAQVKDAEIINAVWDCQEELARQAQPGSSMPDAMRAQWVAQLEPLKFTVAHMMTLDRMTSVCRERQSFGLSQITSRFKGLFSGGGSAADEAPASSAQEPSLH